MEQTVCFDHICCRACTRTHYSRTGQSDGHWNGDGSLRSPCADNVRPVLEESDEDSGHRLHVGRTDHSCHLADCRPPIRAASDFHRTAGIHIDTARRNFRHA